MYEEDESKLNDMKSRKSSLPSRMRPDWFWNRKEYIKEQKKQAVEDQLKRGAVTGDPAHPLTGDLSRFKSTVTEEEDEKD
jgi:hypothetical protein